MELSGLQGRLEASALEHLRNAYADGGKRLRSALASFAEFAEAVPERELLRRPTVLGETDASLHNEWTFVLWIEFMALRVSPQTKKPVQTSTISQYLSTLKEHFSIEYGFDVVDQRASRRVKRVLRAMRRTGPQAVTRSRRRGLRRRHLRRAWRKCGELRGTSPTKVNEWAAVSAAWSMLARGGEVAPSVLPGEWCPTVHPTRADLSFGSTPRHGRFATVLLRPIKRPGGVPGPKVPIIIAEHDGGGSDAYAALARLEEYDPVPPAERWRTPLFRTGSSHMRTSDLRRAVKSIAAAAGVPREDVGAHSPRIGGGTDLVDADASPLLLQAKGRWAGDIGRIYARMTRRSQIAASQLMQASHSRDIEELFPTFTQPAF